MDGLGSTRTFTDLNGEVVATYTYDQNGNLKRVDLDGSPEETRDENAARNILAKGLRVLVEYLNSTQGHWGTGVKSPNAQGENDRWLTDSDISHLSRLVELRTVELQESPTRARSV
ncbi:MAG: hypothetical protein J7641_21810 [Cyanobacteria bacterium SID2]|nr:hypothetical protein [Cyanobacteria bacterium SID2]MBP0005612.1 hypothetical protein [Cyanobacteria bacterium SBC]